MLRIISGVVKPKDGHVLIDGEDQRSVPPNERDLGMVFQSENSLFSHWDVFDNIACAFRHGSRSNGRSRGEWRRLVREMIDRMRLGAHANERIPNLSGGLKQRVAIARALVYQPKILLLDEPLSSLDNHLKSELLELLRKIRDEMGTTFIYVTHDDREARQFSTHVAVMMDGAIAQHDKTANVFDDPVSEDVARVLGNTV